jgi:DNA primase
MNIEEIKNKLDIVEVVQRYIKLKRVGRYYSGLCPFHKETKPSFYVSPEMQIFKCFGCNLGGDVIKFLMQIENLTYNQVLEKIKDEYGLEIEISQKGKAFGEEKKILEINYSALKFFCREIKKNKEVLDYLSKRGLTEKTINDFEIGFSPGNTLLRDYLYSQGYDYELIKKAGLLDHQNFDRFQSRIIFPLRDEKGRLVGFTGRIFPENFPGPKYLNSPETLIFKKSEFLYGLYFSKEHILVQKKIILVEGQMDFLLSWQNNLKNVVAVSGSALTENHLRKLKKYSSNLVLAFDNDNAGFQANLRANLLAQKLGFKVFKLIYDGKDLGEYFSLKETSLADSESRRASLQEENFLNWLLNELLENYKNRKDILSIFLPQIKNLSPLEIDDYLNLLKEKFDIEKEDLKKELQKIEDIYIAEPIEEKVIVEEKTLEEKFSLRVISLIYALEEKNENLSLYLSEKFKDLFFKVLENRLDEEEYHYLEMMKNFYLTTNLNLKREFHKTLKNLKIIFLKKSLKNLSERLKFADGKESAKIIEEINKALKELKNVSKSA